MDKLRESSLLFSLQSLLETEKERTSREARAALARHEEEMHRAREVAEQRRLAAEASRAEEQRRKELEERREVAELQRIEAMKVAAIERARIEAQSAARLAEAGQERAHAIALTKLEEAQRTRRCRTLFWLCASALVSVLGGGAVLYAAVLQPSKATAVAYEKARLRLAEERADAAQRALSAERHKGDALENRLRELQTAQRQAVETAPSARPTPLGPRPIIPERAKNPCADTGDPLDNCLESDRR